MGWASRSAMSVMVRSGSQGVAMDTSGASVQPKRVNRKAREVAPSRLLKRDSCKSRRSAFRPVATAGLLTSFPLTCALLRTTTPPSGVTVCTDSSRTCINCGAVRHQQHSEKASLFESVSIWAKGGWKETLGVQRPIPAEMPVSEGRMASLSPFETKRKKAPSGPSSRVYDVQVAEGTTHAPNSLSCQCRAGSVSRAIPCTFDSDYPQSA